VAITPDRPLDRIVVELLDELERLVSGGSVDEAHVRLDGHVYTVTRPR
jgi:hypothetical protein